MFPSFVNKAPSLTTTSRVVLPFYCYAALSFLIATILLLLSSGKVSSHYFHPHSLAITHLMALGWGTMMILGASHQLVPVLIEGKLFSDKLGLASFVLAGLGIPMLVYGFYHFDMGWPARWGGQLIIASILLYLLNLGVSMVRTKRENVHAIFVFTATTWLLITASIGLMLVYNFSIPFLPLGSIEYLPLHAHLGIIGWFLLLIMGVGSRLIPMFLISKYQDQVKLWWIYGLINGGLVAFVFIFFYTNHRILLFIPLAAVMMAIFLFAHYCYTAYKLRIRKKLDEPMQVSLLSIFMIGLPLVLVIIVILLSVLSPGENIRLEIAYGFVIFFGWITALILGMTFKTLPFIIWNKVYHQLAGKIKTPNPKDLFHKGLFQLMAISYLVGFIFFTVAIFIENTFLLQAGAVLLVMVSFLYNLNIVKMLVHKPTHV